MSQKNALRRYHAAVWDEPIVMEMGVAGRRGCHFPLADEKMQAAVGAASDLVPQSMRRRSRPALPEMSEPDVLRHYLHLSQETMGMMGISLFGTCTMKYNPRLTEGLAARPFVADLHPNQDPATLQGVLQVIYEFDRMLRSLSGMDQFTFQPAGGADAAYTQACITRAYHAAKGQLAQRTQIITSIQSHPCNPATSAAAGFEVVTLPLGERGYPSLDALRAAVSSRTAALMINNPDDMGIYNPEIKEWVRIVHEAGGTVLLRSRQLQRRDEQAARTRARLRRLHVHAPQDVRRRQGRRWSRSRCLRLQRRARAVSARPDRDLRRQDLRRRALARRRPSVACVSTGATCTRSSRPMPGREPWAQPASRRPPTCPCC